jgi:hypothetical protein
MFRTITSIVLFVALVGGNAVNAVMSCAPSEDHKIARYAATHCKGALTKTATPMSCCRHMPVTYSEEITTGSPDCCQISAPFPDQSRSATPANSSQEFRLQTPSQFLDPSGPLPSLAMTFAWPSLRITFCPDRSDTYLLASTFRI